MKKVISLIAAGVLTMGIGASAADFSDMPPEHWAYESVMSLVADGTVNGDESGHFNPDKQVTRAEMVKMVGKGSANIAYGDVDESHWGYEYITTSGVSADENGNFRPSEAMTRGDVIELLWSRAGAPTDCNAPDNVKSQHKNPQAAAWGYETGVMKGYEDGNMLYENGISRAEAAAVIVRSRADSKTDYSSVLAANPNLFENVYSSIGAFDGDMTYGGIAKSAAVLGGADNAKSLIPDGKAEADKAAASDAAKMIVTAVKRLNSNVPSFTEGEYLTVPLDGDADTQKIGAILYMIDKKAPLGIKCIGGKTENVSIITNDTYPADGCKFVYHLSEIPSEVYAAPIGNVSKQPYDNFKFAMEFGGLFTTVTEKCEKIAKESTNIDAKITYYPSLVWNTGSSYKYRVKCEIISVNGQSLEYNTVFGGESKEILKGGMVFYADIESDYAFGMGVGALFDFSDPVYIVK